MKRVISLIFLINTFLFSASTPPGLNFVKTVDWSNLMDKTEVSLDLCKCSIDQGGESAGFKATLAEPIGLIETTNTPWNVVSFGLKFDESMTRKQGTSGYNGNNRRYTHVVAIAPLGSLNFMQDYICFERLIGTSFLYWSEILPTQTNDVMALFTQAAKGPLSKIWYNNPIGTAACAVDCPSATFGKPINALHWCAGCSGVTGNNTAYGKGKASDPITATHVSALSAIDDLHFAGALSKVSNATFTFSPTSKIPNSMCQPQYFPMSIKTQYELNLAYPTVWDATKIGELRTKWAEFKNKPKSGNDVAFWLWSIKDTCVGSAKCKSMFSRSTN